MARPQSIRDDALMARLSSVFRDVGYEGASLALLAQATGLKRASLYHRFPNGKQQMAEEVLASALGWYAVNIIAPLLSDALPSQRIATVARQLDTFYAGGQHACLLNMLSSPRAELGPFSEGIKGAFDALVSAFTVVARDAGCDAKVAKRRAERTVMLLQGSLVMSRGLGSSKPFETFLEGLADDLMSAPDPVAAGIRSHG